MARSASALFDARAKNCALSPFILMSDPRLKTLESAAQMLPQGSALIYRHFGDVNAAKAAGKLRQICFAKGLQFLIGNDAALAISSGADGVHFSQANMEQAELWRARCPDWILTAATHDKASIMAAQALPLDAITLSPVFPSDSPSAVTSLGLDIFKSLAELSALPVIALGGINYKTAPQLKSSRAAGIAGVSGLLGA